MKENGNSNLIMWKEAPGRFRFQTTDPKLRRQMKGRKTFHLAAYSINEKLWIYYCDLPSVSVDMSRFSGIIGRNPKYDSEEEIYYCERKKTTYRSKFFN